MRHLRAAALETVTLVFRFAVNATRPTRTDALANVSACASCSTLSETAVWVQTSDTTATLVFAIPSACTATAQLVASPLFRACSLEGVHAIDMTPGNATQSPPPRAPAASTLPWVFATDAGRAAWIVPCVVTACAIGALWVLRHKFHKQRLRAQSNCAVPIFRGHTEPPPPVQGGMTLSPFLVATERPLDDDGYPIWRPSFGI